MKKILIFLLATLFVLSSVLLVACNTNVVSLKIEGAPSEVTRGSTVDYSKISVVATLDDQSTKTLKLTDKGVTYDPISTATVRAETLTVYYGGKSAQTVIQVVEGDIDLTKATFNKYDNTKGYKDYEEAIKEQTENKENEFVDRSETSVLYTVGVDNGYRFLPQVTAIVDGYPQDVTIKKFNTTFKLYRQVGGSFTPVAESDLTDWLDKWEDNIYYFNLEAVGEVFKMEVTLDESYKLIDEEMNTTVSQTFRVVEGYNVYDALGLSVLDNRNLVSWADIKNGTYLDWDNGKALTDFYDVKQVILHNSITVTVEDLPSNYFWVEGEESKKSGGVSYEVAYSRAPGGLKDYLPGSIKEVYLGEEWENESDGGQRALFVSNGIGISGNYLMLSYDSNYDKDNPTGKGIYIVHDNSQTTGATFPESHTSFVAFTHAIEGTKEEGIVGTRTIENVKFVGQNPKTENTDGLPAGLMMLTTDMANVKVINTISTDWYCNIDLDGVSVGTLDIENCKFYDSFSQMVFSWGIKAITVKNSEMKRAGGPIFILQTVTPSGSKNVSRDTVMNIDSASQLESWVTGGEEWFKINKVNGVADSLFGTLDLVDGYGQRHFRVTDEKGYTRSNLIAVVIPKPTDLNSNQTKVPGTINIGSETYGMDGGLFGGFANLSEYASTGVTLATAINNTQLINGFNQLKTGLASNTLYQQLLGAPVMKLGENFAYIGQSGTSFTFNDLQSALATYITPNVTDLYAGVQNVISQLSGQPSVAAEWEALRVNLEGIATATAMSNANWLAGWRTSVDHHVALYVNSNYLGSGNKHFMVLFGEGAAA